MLALLIQDPQKTPPPNYATGKAVEVDEYGQLTKLASTFDHVDGLFYFTYVVCIFFFLLITGALLYSVVRYRRKTFDQPAASNVTHNTPLEVVWTVIPLLIVMVMFAWGFKGSLDMTTVPSNALRFKATAKQWAWNFSYPTSAFTSLNEVWVPVNQPCEFLLESTDVLHAFFLPSQRVKRDVVPGRYQSVWFTPTEVGDYHLFCAEYCGLDHSRMYAKLHVVTAEEFAENPWEKIPKPEDPIADRVDWGKSYYEGACRSCHTLDGTPMTGPSWKGLFVKQGDEIVGGQRDVLVNGQQQTITVDFEYIKESIHMPNAKLAAGFPNGGMSPFADLDDARINLIIDFMKSIAE